MSSSRRKNRDEKQQNKTNNDEEKEIPSFVSSTDGDGKEVESELARKETRRDEMIKRSDGYREVVVERSHSSKTYIIFPPPPRYARYPTRLTGSPVEKEKKEIRRRVEREMGYY
jgi:hypothetical protein